MPARFPAVLPLTFQGKFLCFILRILCAALALFKGKEWERPIPNFEENPLRYRFRDLLYFAYKYYYRPPIQAENQALEDYFHAQKLPFAKAEELQSCISISVGGDLMPYSWITKESCTQLWDKLGPWYFSSDIVFANLETPIAPSKKPGIVPEVMLSNMYFNGTEEMFHIFNGNGQYKGHDVLSTANNHSLDQGADGLIETLQFLDQKNIQSTGTQATEEKRIAIVEREGIRFAFVAATYCLNAIQIKEEEKHLVNLGDFNLPNCDLSELDKLVQEARAQADVVLLSLHTGNAYQAYPSEHTTEIMHRIFELCEPDAILGSHPHNPQAPEYYSYTGIKSGQAKKGLCIYSQGDFVAYDIFTWCHFHLGFKLYFSSDKSNPELKHVEVYPSMMKQNKSKFQFVPVTGQSDSKEQDELQRFWKQHLSPSLSAHLAPSIG
ncbi:MAG: CapA family protein [Bacteroidetes bacterium]|nr:MAG: CapA family protein [Bacteroidota bacterium]